MATREAFPTRSVLVTVASVLFGVMPELPSGAAEPNPCPATVDSRLDNFFADEVWPKVGAADCLKCHRPAGEAEDTRFVLQDLSLSPESNRAETMRRNRNAFVQIALQKADGRPVLLVKVTGGLDHGGEEVLPPDSTGYRILEDFVHRVTAPHTVPSDESLAETMESPFFKNVEMLDDRRLLRRATLSLAGRLPTDSERTAVEDRGLQAIPAILDDVMREEAFFDRMREGFNDIFLTLGIDGNADATVLSYEHFEKTRLWYQRYDLSHIKDDKERRQAGYKLADDYRAALLGEPMKLIEYIVRGDRPFTEIVTADYIMVSPYTARGYGIFDEVQERFTNADDPFEYIPVKLKALVGRNKSENQESATGYYPHAGLLSTFQYLSRYPTTETNRNRLRARMYYQHFLGVDVLELAARVSDAAAVTARFDTPTMQASECAVCHKTVDPVAGLFQNYWRFEANFAIYGRRKDGWFTDMFAAGFEGQELPADQRAAAGLGMATPIRFSRNARAAAKKDLPSYDGPYYIVFNAAGGWDTTYLMDPKGVGDINRLYDESDIRTHGVHRFAPTAEHKQEGLSNEEFYAEFGDELLVLNGLDYSINNHSPCSRYMATGKLDSLAYPTFAALVAACQGPACPLSFLTFGNYSATGNLVAMSRVPYLPSLQRIANADAIDGNLGAPYHDDFALDRIERALGEQRSDRAMQPLLPRQQRAENMLYAAQVNSKALARVTPHIPKEVPTRRLAQQAEIALASFKAGVCVSANLSIGQFDSHADNDQDQMKLIPEFLEGIAYVLHRAEKLQIRDKLVVIAQSEMGRTPTYNSGNGKDHWSIGSIMFLGPGIRGNRVVGATDEGQFSVPINPRSLELDPDHGLRVRPEHIHFALRELAGIAEHPHCRQFPFKGDNAEFLRTLWGS